MSVSSIIYCACVASSFLFAKYFIRCLAPSVACGAQVLPAAAAYHSTIRYFIRCLACSVAFGAQVLPAASYHSTIPPARPTFSEIFLCVEKNNNSTYVPISTNNNSTYFHK